MQALRSAVWERAPDRKQGRSLGRPTLCPNFLVETSEIVIMQLELFCAEESVSAYEQRIASHVQRERIARLLATPRCPGQTRSRPVKRTLSISFIEPVARRVHFLWCTAMPRRRSSCTALS
jgi:hypothetical protein